MLATEHVEIVEIVEFGPRRAQRSRSVKDVAPGPTVQVEAENGPMAVIAASRDGARLASLLALASSGAELYVLSPYLADAELSLREHDQPGAAVPIRAIQPPLSSAAAQLFRNYRELVFFLPVGAVVRLVAPHLRDKRSDPAVVAVDDQGEFAVSVLSGHAGGANSVAQRAAAALDAIPVITTAAEQRGYPSVEEMGKPFGWRQEATREALLRVSAALVNEDVVALYQDPGLPNVLPRRAHWRRLHSLRALLEYGRPAGIIVTMRRLPEDAADRYVIWRPRHLVAGVGCSSGASADELESLLHASLVECDCAVASIGVIATLDRKLGEPGIVELAARLEADLRGYSSNELADVTVPNPSDEVRRAVGTPSVAEAAALRAVAAGYLIAAKRTSAHATVAIALDTTSGVSPFRSWERRRHPERFPSS